MYPSDNGPLLGALAAAAAPRRILEVGCGLGYSALWLACGAGRKALVETIEADDEHAAIARSHFKTEGFGRHIRVLVGEAAAVLPTLKRPYDLLYFDTDPAESLTVLEHSKRLLRKGGVLISSNLFLGQFAPGIRGLDKIAEYRRRILDARRWQTAYLADGTAISVRKV